MQEIIDEKKLEGLDPELRKRIEQVSKKDIELFTLELSDDPLDDGDEKIGELTYTELLVIVASGNVSTEGEQFLRTATADVVSPEWNDLKPAELEAKVTEKQSQLDRFSTMHLQLVYFAFGLIHKRLNLGNDAYLEYRRDYSLVRPSLPYPKCPHCGRRGTCATPIAEEIVVAVDVLVQRD